MVFCIIGAVFAAIQLIVAASGASEYDEYYASLLSSRCTSVLSSTVCDEVSHFSHVNRPGSMVIDL